MIFPVKAIYRETKVVLVDPDNEDHEKYLAKGEISFKETTDYHGIALGYDKFDVISHGNTGAEYVVPKEYILFAENKDGYVLSFVPMEDMIIPQSDFDNALRRIYAH